MPISEYIEGAVKGISDALDNAKPDVGALRRRLADRADRCLLSARDGNTDDAWLTEADTDTIAFSPTTDTGQPLLMNGKSTTFWPNADAFDAIQKFRDAINRGEFDDQLTSGGAPTISPKVEGEQLPNDPDNGSMTTGGGRTDADEVETRFTEHLGDHTNPSRARS